MADTSVDWELARQVATKIGDRNSAVSSYHYATLSPDFERFTAQAEELVAETTGLVSQMETLAAEWRTGQCGLMQISIHFNVYSNHYQKN